MRPFGHVATAVLLASALLVSAPANAQDQSFKAVYQKGIELYQSLDYEAALAQFELAATLAKGGTERAQSHVMRGVVLAELGRTEEAQKDFRAALRLKP